MKIKTLSAHGLKAGAFSHELQGVNVIVGRNFAGKTSRLEAARLALMGYLPELGKTNAATFTLASGTEMDVGVVLDDGGTMSRRWRMERGAIKATESGELPEIPPVLLDPSVYFALGDKDRMRYVFGLAKCESLDGKPVADVLISKLKSIKLDPHTAEHEAVIDALVGIVDTSDRERHEAEQAVQEWIEGLVTEMRDRLKGAKQAVDRMTKTVQGLVAVTAQDDEAAIQNVQKQIEKCRQDIKHLTEERATLAEQVRAAKAAETDRQATQEALKWLSDRSEDIAEGEKRLADLQAELTTLKSQQATMLERVATIERDANERARITQRLAGALDHAAEIEQKQKALLETQAAVIDYESMTERVQGKLQPVSQALNHDTHELARLEAELHAREAKHAEDLLAKSCPHCGAKGKNWQDSIVAEYDAFREKRSNELSTLRIKIADGDATGQALLTQLNDARVADQRHRERVKAMGPLTQQLDTLRRSQTEATELRAKLSAIQVDPEALKTAKGELETVSTKADATARRRREIEQQTSNARASHQQFTNLTAKLSGMGKPEVHEVDREATLNGMDATLSSYQQDVSKLEQRQRAYHAAKTQEQTNAKVLLEQRQHAADVAVTKACVEILEALQGELVRQAFGVILERASKVTAGILKGELAYRDGEIGRYDGGTWISHRTFSGAEKALTYAGISLALAWDSPIKIVLMDELNGHLDQHNIELVLNRMIELVRGGVIDQFIGAATEFEPMLDVNLILV